MRKRRGSLARLVTVFLALVAGLSLMGVGVSYWSEMLSIIGTVEMGTVGFNLTATDNYTDPEGGSVTCEVVSDALEVTVIDASTDYAYYGDFAIENIGDIPVKVVKQELTEVSYNVSTYPLPTAVPLTACKWYYVDVNTVPPTVTESDTPPPGGAATDDDFAFHLSDYQQFQQIDPGDTESGTVQVYLTDSTKEGDDFDLTVTFEVVRWNK